MTHLLLVVLDILTEKRFVSLGLRRVVRLKKRFYETLACLAGRLSKSDSFNGNGGRFNIPVVTFVDTPGAYPGIGAEERGQSAAIAENIMEMFDIPTPIISVIIGEGGSGGALGIAVADDVQMLEYSIYSVISPESCASILWGDPKRAEQAANALQLSPQKAKELGIIDGIISEPLGGAQRSPKLVYDNVTSMLSMKIKGLRELSTEDLLNKRFQKFRQIGNHAINGIN